MADSYIIVCRTSDPDNIILANNGTTRCLGDSVIEVVPYDPSLSLTPEVIANLENYMFYVLVVAFMAGVSGWAMIKFLFMSLGGRIK